MDENLVQLDGDKTQQQEPVAEQPQYIEQEQAVQPQQPEQAQPQQTEQNQPTQQSQQPQQIQQSQQAEQYQSIPRYATFTYPNRKPLPQNIIYDPINNVYYSVGGGGGSPSANKKSVIFPIVAVIVAIATMIILFFSYINLFSYVRDSIRYGDYFMPYIDNGGYDDYYSDYDNSFYDPGGISSTELDKIKLGMTYAHVSAVIGGDGIIAATNTDLRGNNYIVYAWTSETDDYSTIYITFTLDVVSDITIDGVVD